MSLRAAIVSLPGRHRQSAGRLPGGFPSTARVSPLMGVPRSMGEQTARSPKAVPTASAARLTVAVRLVVRTRSWPQHPEYHYYTGGPGSRLVLATQPGTVEQHTDLQTVSDEVANSGTLCRLLLRYKPLFVHLPCGDFQGWYPGGKAAGGAVGATALGGGVGAATLGAAVGATGAGWTTSGAAGTAGAAVADGTVSAAAACSSAILTTGKDMSKINPTTNFRMIELLIRTFISRMTMANDLALFFYSLPPKTVGSIPHRQRRIVFMTNPNRPGNDGASAIALPD